MTAAGSVLAAAIFLGGCEPDVRMKATADYRPWVLTVEKVVPAACEPDLPPEPAVPDGFPATDEFPDDAQRAGRLITARVVCDTVIEKKNDVYHCADADEEQRRRSIYRHWKARIGWASGKGAWTSKLKDGTKIHDRDRPAGYVFWHRAVQEGWLTPETCAWHRIDPHVGHHALEFQWAADWPFTSSPQSKERLDTWIRESHDYERFVARGPNDGSPAYMSHLFQDRCFDPAQFDRNDVSAYAHARKTLLLCGHAEADGVPCTYGYLRCTWGSKGRKRCRERAAASAAKKEN
jgi:hypothetical protein